MRSTTPIDPLVCDYRPSSTPAVHTSVPAALPSPEIRVTCQPGGLTGTGDTGVEFLGLYRQLLAAIGEWCAASGAPITQMIRRQALRDYVEVYCHTYPRQPAYPFPPRFGRYVAYLDGFDEVVTAIDGWCEWLSDRFLPGVVPIDLIRSALDEWDTARRWTERSSLHALPPVFASLSATSRELV